MGRSELRAGSQYDSRGMCDVIIFCQSEEFWVGVNYGLAASMIQEVCVMSSFSVRGVLGRSELRAGSQYDSTGMCNVIIFCQSEEFWVGVNYGLAASMIQEVCVMSSFSVRGVLGRSELRAGSQYDSRGAL